jgi:hypothetical protein
MKKICLFIALLISIPLGALATSSNDYTVEFTNNLNDNIQFKRTEQHCTQSSPSSFTVSSAGVVVSKIAFRKDDTHGNCRSASDAHHVDYSIYKWNQADSKYDVKVGNIKIKTDDSWDLHILVEHHDNAYTLSPSVSEKKDGSLSVNYN